MRNSKNSTTCKNRFYTKLFKFVHMLPSGVRAVNGAAKEPVGPAVRTA